MLASDVGSHGAEDETMSIADTGHGSVDLDEAARQLEQAAHDAEVACDSIRLGNLDWAHTNAITARAAADAAENALRAALQIAPHDGPPRE
jgi:HEPN domain-containing protein